MSSRLGIKKTYKLFIGGKFPRTESGRFLELRDAKGELLANVSWGSVKDFRNAVVAARASQVAWAKNSAYLKGQILYRIAEVLDGRRSQFVEELVTQGITRDSAEEEVSASIDLFVHYAGWSDKYGALFSNVNPVASSHFNFSVPEPTGVVGILAPHSSGLLGLVSTLAPVVVGGNSAILLASEKYPLCAISLGEVLATSDVPNGVVNILTGQQTELAPAFASHLDVNALLVCSEEQELLRSLEWEAAENLKRVIRQLNRPLEGSPYHILDFQETKTTWHPVGV